MYKMKVCCISQYYSSQKHLSSSLIQVPACPVLRTSQMRGGKEPLCMTKWLQCAQ